MNHFSADEWVDFTRRLLPPSKMAAMQTALDEGCSECQSSLQLWQAILQASLNEREYQPAEASVKAIKEAYLSEKPWKWMISVAEFARVLFDGFHRPVLPGVRSFAKSSRQITVESEPFLIDLQLESDSAGQRISLTGQVLNTQRSQAGARGTDVVLLSADNFVQRTKANELGEFCLDFNRKNNLRLFINIFGQRAIGIVLPDLTSSESDI